MALRAADLLPAILAVALLTAGSGNDPASSSTHDAPVTQLTLTPVR
jgi:hypothetical protein